MSADFAEHWSHVVMPQLHREARLAAINIVCVGDWEIARETFDSALAGLERRAHDLGAGHMPETYQIELHAALARSLVNSIGAVLDPWRAAQTTAAMVGADVAAWDRRVRQWAGFIEPSEQSGQPGAHT